MNYQSVLANLADMPSEAAGTTSIPEFVLTTQPSKLQSWILRELVFGNLLKKNPNIIIDDIDPDAAAADAFYAGEQRCLNYNTHFGQLVSNPRLASVIFRWRKKVQLMMGRIPKLKFDVVTSGATTNSPRGNSPLERFSAPECTPDLFDLMHSFGPPTPFVLWDWRSVTLTNGSVAKFVAKTAKVSRLVNPEPAVNASVQRELGQILNRRCRLFGIEIETGQDRHRDMAWLSSILGHLATDDQSNASGHIYTELVKFLVSHDWWVWLDGSRSKFTQVESSPIHDFTHWWKLNTFATMGNGFCFELETILFYSLIWTVAGDRSDISVFGDDCIYPVEHVNAVHKTFKNVGFVINEEKSFSSGFFRESCGGDFLFGHNVRPLYLKRKFDNSYDLTIMANQVYERFVNQPDCDVSYVDLWNCIVQMIPEEERLYGPAHLGDAVLHTPDESMWSVTTVGKRHKRKLIRVWTLIPESTTSFGKIVYRGIQPDLAVRLIANGYMKGWGLVRRKDKEGKETCVYKSHAAPGTRYRPVIEQRAFSSASNSVDETNPLSVFDILKSTQCPKRLYDSNALKQDLADSRAVLCSLLLKLKEKTGTFNASSIDVDF